MGISKKKKPPEVGGSGGFLQDAATTGRKGAINMGRGTTV
jgi:hypothetical protein